MRANAIWSFAMSNDCLHGCTFSQHDYKLGASVQKGMQSWFLDILVCAWNKCFFMPCLHVNVCQKPHLMSAHDARHLVQSSDTFELASLKKELTGAVVSQLASQDPFWGVLWQETQPLVASGELFNIAGPLLLHEYVCTCLSVWVDKKQCEGTEGGGVLLKCGPFTSPKWFFMTP